MNRFRTGSPLVRCSGMLSAGLLVLGWGVLSGGATGQTVDRTVVTAELSKAYLADLAAEGRTAPAVVVLQDSLDFPFATHAAVTPASAPIGVPFDFHFTVTNISSETAGFTIGGCPVQVLVDGVFSPFVPCAEFAREILLEPGESITFGPDQDPSLHFDPHEFPLGPGPHRVLLWMPGIGESAVEIQVEEPDAALAYAAGQVAIENWLRLIGTATLIASNDPATGVLDGIQTPLGPLGHFLFDRMEPGSYLLRVDVLDGTWWYPGTPDPSLATEIELPAGKYVDGLRMEIPPPPPWPGIFSISGTVYEDCPECGAIPGPLAGAVVRAEPVFAAPPDSSSDSTGVVPGDPPGGAGFGTKPMHSHPELVEHYVATTDEAGRFTLELPEGSYRLVAGRLPTHRYQYWNHVSTFGEAGFYPVPSRIAEPSFALLPGENLPAVLTGIVYGEDPMRESPALPIEGAEVQAIPVIASPFADFRAFTARTGPDGRYRLEVPSDSPYRLYASAPGFESAYFRGARYPQDATWVDVAPGETRDYLHFALLKSDTTSGKGSIEGAVYRVYPDADCPSPAGLDECAVPVAGALVRVVPAFPTFAAMEFRTFTGPDGRFRVDGLLAQPDGALSYFVSAQVENSEPVYYPGGVPFPDAVPISVFPQVTSDAGILVLNNPLPGDDGVVFGVVSNTEGVLIEHALVRVFLDPTNPRARVARTRTDSGGEFHVTGLPSGIDVLVSAEAEGHVPVYYPGVFRWRQAQFVTTGGANMRIAPLRIQLGRAITGGPFIQAGLIVVASEGSGSDSGWVEPEPASASPASFAELLDARSRGVRSLSYDLGIRDAFFYLVNALSAAPIDRPVAGGSSGDNGAVILTGLLEGHYIAFADRPGFESAYFPAHTDAPQVLTLDDVTPAVLARIELPPLGMVEQDPAAAAGMLRHLTNVPNPFRPQTVIRYTLLEPRSVTIQIYNQAGRLVRTLARHEIQVAGDWERSWDGRDEQGGPVSPGVYFTRIQAGPDQVARKMVLLP